ncbi:transcription factor HES-7-like [Rhinophrynus dorsalis]
MRNTYLSREDKRLMKPVIEKRRRDRINQSLEHLRTLLLEATQDESLKNPKTEKADILKKTVQFLKMCHSPDPEDGKKALSGFKGGFREGLNQATCFLNTTGSICEKKKEYVVQKLCQHMEKRNLEHWDEPASDVSLMSTESQLLPSPPQISRVQEDLIDRSPEIHSCPPLSHNYPSPSSSYTVPHFGQVLQSSTQNFHANNSKKSMQRTLFPPTTSSSSLSPALVWRPWP